MSSSNHVRDEARLHKTRLISSLAAIVAFALFAGFAFKKGFGAAAVFAVLIVLGISAFAIKSWGRWVDSIRELGEATPPAPDAALEASVPVESRFHAAKSDIKPREAQIDSDLDTMSRDELVDEVIKLRNSIGAHRDSTGHSQQAARGPLADAAAKVGSEYRG